MQTYHTEYIEPNVTIDTIITDQNAYYIYNYKGVYFRVFDSIVSLLQFLKFDDTTHIYETDSETALDRYIEKLK